MYIYIYIYIFVCVLSGVETAESIDFTPFAYPWLFPFPNRTVSGHRAETGNRDTGSVTSLRVRDLSHPLFERHHRSVLSRERA